MLFILFSKKTKSETTRNLENLQVFHFVVFFLIILLLLSVNENARKMFRHEVIFFFLKMENKHWILNRIQLPSTLTNLVPYLSILFTFFTPLETVYLQIKLTTYQIPGSISWKSRHSLISQRFTRLLVFFFSTYFLLPNRKEILWKLA